MQYKCMEREIRKLSMEGFYFLICLVYREYSGRNAALAERNQWISVYRFPAFPLSGSQGALRAERILQNTLNHDNQAKARISSHPAWARIPGRQVQGCCRKSPSCSPALTPDSERPAILTGTDDHPCFCAALSVVFMQKSCEYRFLVHRHSQLFIHTGYFYFFVKA